MAESIYWDEAEFNFFETLEDEDKLLYLYDLMIGEFAYLPIHEEMERLDAEEAELERLMNGEFGDDEEDDWDFERDRNAVKVEFIHGEVDDIIKLQGPTLEILLKVANDMQMNGMLLTDKKIEFTKYEPWNVILTYKVIGQSPPFSLN